MTKLLNLLGAFTFALVVAGCASPTGPTKAIHITLQDSAAYHVHPLGQIFSITAQIEAPRQSSVFYQWRDMNGTPLSQIKRAPTNGNNITITSPSGDAGYYGLVFTTSETGVLPDRQPGEPREYGFVILPSKEPVNTSSPYVFGTVHADLADPYLPTGTKTLTWLSEPEKAWHSAITQIDNKNKHELPIIMGDGWMTDDSQPVSERQLDNLQEKATAYFNAAPSLLEWEAGLEETLSDNYTQPFYWENLEKKITRLHQAAADLQLPIKIVYQVVGADSVALRTFFEHKAFAYIDILSLHPYAWPDFSAPDLWLGSLLQDLADLKKANHTTIPVWFTEVGAPIFGNYRGGFFGYPDENKQTGGLTRPEQASFMIKLCAMSLSQGIERIFWYNYQDATPARDQVESHFGLRDFGGYPKPSYAAFFQLHQLLTAKKAAPVANLPKDVKGFLFEKNNQPIYVVWRDKADEIWFPFSLLKHKEAAQGRAILTDATGHPVSYKNGGIYLGKTPVFIQIMP